MQQIDDDVIMECNSVASTEFNKNKTAIRLKNVRKVYILSIDFPRIV